MLSGEIALKNSHYYYYYYTEMELGIKKRILLVFLYNDACLVTF